MANDGETMETVTDFIFLGSKITADGDCSHETKRCLLLGRKTITNLDSMLKSRHYFGNKAQSSQSCGFSSSHVWMWELDYKESWVLKNDAFELWCWRRLLRVSWTARRSNQYILKEISPEYSLEGLMLKPKLQYFGHLIQELTPWKRPWCWKDWRQEEKGMTEDEMAGWHQWLDGHESEQALGVGDGQRNLASMGSWRVGHDWTPKLNWTLM